MSILGDGSVVHVGLTVELVADTGASPDGENVTFVVSLPDGTALATLQGTSSSGLARAPWPVAVPDGTVLPVTVQVTAAVAGAAPVKIGTLSVEPDGVSSPPYWLLAPRRLGGADEDGSQGDKTAGAPPPTVIQPAERPLPDADVTAGTVLHLHLEIADFEGKPLHGEFSIFFEFLEVKSDGSNGKSLKTVSRLVTPADSAELAKGVSEITAKWTAKTFGLISPAKIRVRIKWDKRPFEKTAPKDFGVKDAPVLTVHDTSFKIRLQEDAAITGSAREDADRTVIILDASGAEQKHVEGKWDRTQVELTFPGGEVRWANVAPDGTAEVKLPPDDKATATVLRAAPHAADMIWRVTGGGAVAAGATESVLGIGARLRLSVWGAPHHVTDDSVKGIAGVVDDIALLVTLNCFKSTVKPGGVVDPITPAQLAAPLDLMLDPVLFNTPPQALAAYQDVVKRCHEASLQVLAGYTIVTQDNAGQKFNAWLDNPARKPTMREYAEKVFAFLRNPHDPMGPPPSGPAKDRKLHFDGLSFDMERLQAKHRNPFGDFCVTLATLLREENMFVTLAAGRAVQHRPDGTLIAHDKRHAAAELPDFGAGQAQPYWIAREAPNIVIRPQGYDDNPSDLFGWHAALVDYAVNKIGLHPSQFQLGVKVEASGTGVITHGEPVRKRCREILLPARVGLSVFGLSANEGTNGRGKDWKTYDQILNGNVAGAGPVRPGTLGQPLQVALGPADVAKLGK